MKVNAKEVFRAIKYTVVAASAGLIQIGSFTLLYEVLKLDWWLSYLIGLALSVLWNFTINRKATFKTDANYGIAMLKVLAYYAVFTPLSVFGGDWLEGIGWNGFLVEVMFMIINFVTEFLFMTFVVFRGKIDNAEKKKEKKN